MEFIKIATNTSHIWFWSFFQLHNPSLLPFWWRKNRSSENAVQEEWVISFSFGGVMISTWGRRGLLGAWVNWTVSILWLADVFASNLNTINLKLFRNHGEIYRFEEKKREKSWRDLSPLECVSLKLKPQGQRFEKLSINSFW